MIKSIKDICSTCKKNDSVFSDRGKIITTCNSDLQIGCQCFNKNKLELVKNPYNELEINTKYSSYVKFIIEYDEQLAKMHLMRSNSVRDLHMSHIEFPMDMYKKIDLLFTKWGSWYSRIIITLKTLLISGHYCHNFKAFILASIKDYYEAGDKSVRCDISDGLIEVTHAYFMNMEIPTHNGEFVKALNYISICLSNVYKIMITQYANEHHISEGRNIMYYSSDFRVMDIEMEEYIIEYRMNQLIEKFGTVELRFVNNNDITNEESRQLIRTVFDKYKEKITNYENY